MAVETKPRNISASVQSHSAAIREGIVLRPRFVAFGGALPIHEGGQRIGASGVSGGGEEQGQVIAQACLGLLRALIAPTHFQL